MGRDSHTHRAHESLAGPSYVRKEILNDDTCVDLRNEQFRRMDDFKKSIRMHKSEGIFREDPFGLPDYVVSYSMEKKKRWLLPELLEQRIELAQDPCKRVRVSASTHARDRGRHENFVKEGRMCNTSTVDLPTKAYHDVSREGEVVHKFAANARLHNLANPQGFPQRKRKGGRRHPRMIERFQDDNIQADENELFQKLRVHYFAVTMTSTQAPCNKLKSSKDRKHTTKQRKPIFDAEDDDCPEDVVVEEMEPSDGQELPSDSHSLSQYLLPPQQRREKHKRSKSPAKFQDEPLLIPSYTVIPSTSTNEDEDFATFDAALLSRVSLHAQMFTTLPLPTLPLPPLPVSPPSWEVHKMHSLKVIGRHLPACVIVKKLHDRLSLFIVKNCCGSSFDGEESKWERRVVFPTTKPKGPPQPAPLDDFCPICMGDMSGDALNQDSLPFALDCGHFFCTRCWSYHVASSIEAGQLPAPCMDPSCNSVLSIGGAKALLDSPSLLEYTSKLHDSLVSSQKMIKCPQCPRLILYNDACKLTCDCGASICGVCSGLSHRPIPCDMFQQYNGYLRRSGLLSESPSALTVTKLARCRKCSLLLQRSEGCNHIHCLCGFEFCYRCGANWTGSHYGCNRDEFTKVILIDVIPAHAHPLLKPNLLVRSIETRLEWNEKRKELRKRLAYLDSERRAKVCRAVYEMYNLMEHTLLKSPNSPVIGRINLAFSLFFKTRDGKAEQMRRKADSLLEIHSKLVADE